MEYGVIGNPLGHSFSKPIHEALSPISYEIHPLPLEEVEPLLKEKAFKAINVTIPYKQVVIPYLDYVDEKAKTISAVNTIVNKNGKLYGYNTDYGGERKMILDHKIDVKDKICAILGNGGTHNTTYHILKDLGAKEIITVVRKQTEGCITFDELKNHKEIEIIINTTPVGMYPNNYNQLVSIEDYPNLKGVVDVVYNPLRTPLVLDALAHNINATGGLEMLVNQAVIANEYFFSRKNEDALYKDVYKKIYYEKANVVLIGMPMSGKTTIGKRLAKELNKSFVDIDEEIVKKINMTIPEYFAKFGEEEFRRVEAEVTKEISKGTNQVISTGGGIIKSKENMMALKQNGYIVHITRLEKLLIYDDNRPLTKSIEDYKKLKKERLPLYRKYMDVEVKNYSSLKGVTTKIKEAFYESVNY